MARTTVAQLRNRVAQMNKDLRTDFTLGRANGGLRLESHNESRDVSPRLSTGQMAIWLAGFWTGVYKQY